MPTFQDLTGKRIGRLLVLRRTPGRVTRWLCRCDCGTEKEIYATNLLRNTRSCGCLKQEQTRQAEGRACARWNWRNYRKNAAVRGLEFDLSLDDFIILTGQDCYYCGRPPQQIVKRPRCFGVHVYNGIDRLDNTQGYIRGNCVPCCRRCNTAKSNQTLAEFYAQIAAIAARHSGEMGTA